MIEILTSGPFSTIQDKGRFGYQHLGVPTSGALDGDGLLIGNALLGNAPNDSAIEICFGGFRAKAHRDCAICLTGSIAAHLVITAQDGTKTTYEAGRTVAIKSGDICEIPPFGDSLSCLLCLSGGIDVPVIYGSRSTTVTAKLGGYEGRILAAGDKLALTGHQARPIRDAAPDAYAALFAKPSRLRILFGPQDFWFTAEALDALTAAPYRISPQTSRMGMRLIGACLAHKGPADIVSDGMVRGAIQVPADGQPILAMADHGTMGGYTKIGCVINADIAAMGRLRPHDEVRFEVVTHSEAEAARSAQKALITAALS